MQKWTLITTQESRKRLLSSLFTMKNILVYSLKHMKKPTNFKWENLVKQEQHQNGIDVLLSLSLVGEKIQMKSTSSYISINNSSYGHLEQFFEYLFFSIFMTFNLHRKIKFTITRYFKNMYATGEKIKIKK